MSVIWTLETKGGKDGQGRSKSTEPESLLFPHGVRRNSEASGTGQHEVTEEGVGIEPVGAAGGEAGCAAVS